MDKFKTIGVGGLGLILDDFRWFFGRLTNPNDGIYEAFNNLLRGVGDNFIVQGVVASGTTPNVAITEGWVILNGELIKVDAQTGIDTTTDNKFVKDTSFDSRGTKTFLNGSIEETYEKNRAIISGTTGNLAFNGDTFETLAGIVNTMQDGSANLRTKTKKIDIGIWDMDSLVLVNIAHGLTLSKIITTTVTIIEDSGEKHTQRSDGIIIRTDSANVRINRITSGIFDSIDFSSSSNRGFIIIQYEV